MREPRTVFDVTCVGCQVDQLKRDVRRPSLKSILTTLGVVALVGVLTALAVIYSGLFNVGATVSDAAPLKWMFITTREASIKRQAKSVTGSAPKGAEAVERGFRSFKRLGWNTAPPQFQR